MAMLVIEDGSCLSGATSYVELADAEAYCIPRGLWPATAIEADTDAGTETPDAAMLARKEAALMRAFDYLNGPLDWLGEKPDWQRQAAWPRANVPLPGGKAGEFVPDDMVPEAVKRAQMELAALIFNGNDLLAPVERGGRIASRSDSRTEAVDVISESESHSISWADNAPVESWLPAVYPILKPFLASLPGKSSGFCVVPVLAG